MTPAERQAQEAEQARAVAEWREEHDREIARRETPKLRRLVDWSRAVTAREREQARVYGPPDITPPNANRYEARERLASLSSGFVPPLFAVVVETWLCRGGPEEGGWYYDRSVILEVRLAWGFRSLLAVVRELRAGHRTCRYGRTSCAGGSDVEIYLTRCEHKIASLEGPDEPPEYS